MSSRARSVRFTCALLIALSHAPDARLPPRAVAGPRWLGIAEYVFGAGSARPAVARVMRVTMFVVWGAANEWWAAMRLMP